MIQPIVEGHGEVQAVPVLLRRLIPELGCYVEVGTPIRQKRTEIVREQDFKRAIQLARLRSETRAVLVLFDADDDCARDIVPPMRQWAQEVAPDLPCAVVLARREYEAWFLAALESLRGQRNIRADAAYPQEPEAKRGRRAFWVASSRTTSLTARPPTSQRFRRCSTWDKPTAGLPLSESWSGSFGAF